MRSRTGTVLEGLDKLGGDELAPERQRRAPGPGARGRRPAEVAVAARTEVAEIARAARGAPAEGHPAGGQPPRAPGPQVPPAPGEHDRRPAPAGAPPGLGPRASQRGAPPGAGQGSPPLAPGLNPRHKHLNAPA